MKDDVDNVDDDEDVLVMFQLLEMPTSIQQMQQLLTAAEHCPRELVSLTPFFVRGSVSGVCIQSTWIDSSSS